LSLITRAARTQLTVKDLEKISANMVKQAREIITARYSKSK